MMFVYPHPPGEGLIWRRRPCYFSSFASWDAESGPGSYTEHSFSWACAFCEHRESTDDNYGVVSYACPECGAVFIGDDDFGTWMAKEMPEEWAKGRRESYC